MGVKVLLSILTMQQDLSNRYILFASFRILEFPLEVSIMDFVMELSLLPCQEVVYVSLKKEVMLQMELNIAYDLVT